MCRAAWPGCSTSWPPYRPTCWTWCTSGPRRSCTSTRWRCSCRSRPGGPSTPSGCCPGSASAGTRSPAEPPSRLVERAWIPVEAARIPVEAARIPRSAREGDRVDDLDLELLAVGRLVGDLLTLLVADDGRPEGALRGVHL